MDYIFLLLYMPGNFLLEARNFKFYLTGCCSYLHSFKYSWALFWNSVLPETIWSFWVLLLRFVRWDLSRAQWKANFSQHCITIQYWVKILLCILPNSSWIMKFSIGKMFWAVGIGTGFSYVGGYIALLPLIGLVVLLALGNFLIQKNW